MSQHPTPPRRAVRILEAVVEPGERAHLLADLEEGFARRLAEDSAFGANRWYWRQVAILVPPLAFSRVSGVITSGALVLDLRRAARSLRRSPAMTVATVVTLGIGIAGPTAAFGVISAMFAPLPVEGADRVVAVELLDRESGQGFAAPWFVYESWSGSTGFEATGAYTDDDEAVSGPGFAPARVPVARITPGVLEALAVTPILGRALDSSDLDEGNPRAALISEELWEEWFDRESGALGSELIVGGFHHSVVGVMPSSFGFPHNERVWTPLRVDDDLTRVDVVARLVAERSAPSVEAELSTALTYPDGVGIAWDRTGVMVEEFVVAQHGRRTRTLLWGLNLLVGLLVVIAAANVSALFLARGITRTSETAVRMSTGGSRWAVMRPLALEALLVSALGGALAVSAAHLIVSWLGANLDARGQVPYWADFGLSTELVGFAVVLMAGATLVAGVAPAARTTRVDLAREMQKEGRGGSPQRIPVLSTLVATEVALACVLLVTSAFIVRAALATVQRVGAFPMDGVLTAELLLESYAYPDTASRQLFWSDLTRILAEDRGVDAFALATAMPGDGTSDAWIALDGSTYERPEDWPRSQRRVVSPGFFDMFGMELADGRAFTDGDGFTAPRVAVVNDAWVEEHANGVTPVGREVRVRERDGDAVVYTIVGRALDPGVSVDDGERVAAIFLPVAQRQPPGLLVGVRMLPGARRPLEALTEAVRSIDRDLPIDNTMTLEAIVRRENDGGRILGLLFGSLGLAALLLAIVGLHGVVSFNAAQRVHAIGVMRALGAPESSVLRDVLTRGMRPVGIGLVAGMALAWLVTPILGREMLEGESAGPHDPLIFLLVPIVLLGGALVAAGKPALRAARIDPVAALKAD